MLRSNLALGTTMARRLPAASAVGATIWVRHLMPKVEMTEAAQAAAPPATEDREAFDETFKEGADASQFVKRPLMRRTLIAATVPVALAPIVLLRDLGPLPGTSLEHTVWRKGMRLIVYGTNRPITPAEFSTPGGMITVVPEGYQDDFDALAKAAVIIIKFRPGVLQPPTVMNWTVDDIVAYSKICTHVGCPAALYEQTTHHILCPCHQSTFDATRGAKVIFGPATRRAAAAADHHGRAGLPGRAERLPRAGRPELLGAVMSVERGARGRRRRRWTTGSTAPRASVTLLRKIFPDHWSFLLGEIALYSFIILLLTGTFLTLFFQPSMTEVVYHGSYTHLDGVKMSEAYASTLNISFDVRGGLLMRQIHHWAADLFMAAIMAHMLRIFFTGAYRKPREVNWLIGIALFTLAMLEGLFGYSLPDDLLSGAGLRITEGVLQSHPDRRHVPGVLPVRRPVSRATRSSRGCTSCTSW